MYKIYSHERLILWVRKYEQRYERRRARKKAMPTSFVLGKKVCRMDKDIESFVRLFDEYLPIFCYREGKLK